MPTVSIVGNRMLGWHCGGVVLVSPVRSPDDIKLHGSVRRREKVQLCTVHT